MVFVFSTKFIEEPKMILEDRKGNKWETASQELDKAVEWYL